MMMKKLSLPSPPHPFQLFSFPNQNLNYSFSTLQHPQFKKNKKKKNFLCVCNKTLKIDNTSVIAPAIAFTWSTQAVNSCFPSQSFKSTQSIRLCYNFFRLSSFILIFVLSSWPNVEKKLRRPPTRPSTLCLGKLTIAVLKQPTLPTRKKLFAFLCQTSLNIT